MPACVRNGLLTRIVAATELLDAADDATRRITEYAPLALRTMKAAVNRLLTRIDDDILSEPNEARIRVSRTDDVREGLQAFLERRRPHFASR